MAFYYRKFNEEMILFIDVPGFKSQDLNVEIGLVGNGKKVLAIWGTRIDEYKEELSISEKIFIHENLEIENVKVQDGLLKIVLKMVKPVIKKIKIE